ncbi:MAG: Nif3-like dinuclear metal center hexameric protein [Spirochaetes bacterium]|nr:Nif3-like dinuclear metal center hexameric protein [Spirochaetota bacterium]
MKITHKELFDYLEKQFPLQFQEDYDNSGKQISFENETVNGILISMDVSPAIISEAIEHNCNCIITHHPMLFKPVKHICDYDCIGEMIISCIKNTISVYAAHTNADAVCWDLLAKSLELHNIELMFADRRFNNIGYGAIGEYSNYMQLTDVVYHTSQCLRTKPIIYYGNPTKKIKRVAALQGAGSRKINTIIANFSVDCIITGDVGYHDAVFANNNGVAIIDTGHYASEKPLIDFLYSILHNYLTNEVNCNDIPLMISQKEYNPMQCGKEYGP